MSALSPSRLRLLLVALATLFHIGLQASGIVSDSPTFDEVTHLPSGYVGLLDSSIRLNREHPPLVKAWAALPLLAMNPSLPPDPLPLEKRDQWTFGQQFLFYSGNDPSRLFTAARTMVVLLNSLLIPLVALAAWLAFGPRTVLLAVLLAATCPLLLGHGHLITTDAPTALWVLTSSLAGFFAWSRPGIPSFVALLFSVALGTATKYSFPIAALGFPLAAFLATPGGLLPRIARTLPLGGVAAVGVLLGMALAWGWPPDFAAYGEGMARVQMDAAGGYRYFVLGRFEEGNWWGFFPLAFLVKASPALLVGLLLAPWPSPSSREAAASSGVGREGFLPFLLLPPLAYGILIVTTAPHLGVRYLLPCFPTLWVLGSAVARGSSRMCHRFSVFLTLLCLWTAFSARPDPIGWFNGMFGCGNSRPAPCLDESSADWGQGSIRLKQEIELRYPGVIPRVSAYGTAPVNVYQPVVPMQREEFHTPYRAVYAITSRRLSRGLNADGDAGWFQGRMPDQILGGTFRIYDLRGNEELPMAP